MATSSTLTVAFTAAMTRPPTRATPSPIASSPSGWIPFWRPIGATPMGAATSAPSSVVLVLTVATRRPGRSAGSASASRRPRCPAGTVRRRSRTRSRSTSGGQDVAGDLGEGPGSRQSISGRGHGASTPRARRGTWVDSDGRRNVDCRQSRGDGTVVKPRTRKSPPSPAAATSERPKPLRAPARLPGQGGAAASAFGGSTATLSQRPPVARRMTNVGERRGSRWRSRCRPRRSRRGSPCPCESSPRLSPALDAERHEQIGRRPRRTS